MTLTLVEDILSEEEQLEQLAHPTVKCSWCGQIIRLDGEELALAMCDSCYEGMLEEYERSMRDNQCEASAR